MNKVSMSEVPWVMFKDGSYKNCRVTLVHQWIRENIDGTIDEMGIIVVQPNDPKDSHPFCNTVTLEELDFIAFR
jgi:hypothetical protein